MIRELLLSFLECIEREEIEIYNEFSLQFELGIFLRNKLNGYKVQFERNTKFWGINNLVKHEIDIVVYNDTERYAIELKYPLNGQYPEQMYSFIKDIRFAEELKKHGFNNTYCLTVVKDKNFYSGVKIDGIYAFFRNNATICGRVCKPTGSKDEALVLDSEYSISWTALNRDMMYYIVEIQ